MAQKLEFRFHIKSPDTNQDFVVPPGTTLVGREPSSGLQLAYPLVSRRHAQLVRTDDECTIMDLGSANGTVVNDLKLEPNVPVKLADRTFIQIGPFEITCEVVPIQEAPVEPAVIEPSVTEPEIPVVLAEEIIQPAPEPSPLVEAPAQPVEEMAGEEAGHVEEAAPSPEPVEQIVEKPAAGARRRGTRAAAEQPAESPPPTPPEPPVPPQKAPPLPQPVPLPPKWDVIPPGLSTQSLHLINYLPGIYQTDFMSRFLGLFESILIPIEWNIDNFDLFLDPDASPFSFLQWLANWYEIVYDSGWSEEQRRTLLEEAHMIYARRGTRWALSRILEIYTGQKPIILESGSEGGPGPNEPFTFFIKLPTGNQNLKQDLLERLIDSNKPAQTTYRLII